MAAYNEESVQWLYDKLQDGYDTGSLDEFKEDLKDDETRKWYHNEATKMGLNVGDEDTFRSLVVPEEVAPPQSTGTVVDQTMEDINRATGHMPQDVQDMAFSGQPQMNGQSLAEKDNPQMFQQPAVDPEPWKAEGLTKEEYEDIAWTRAVNAPTRQAVDEQGRIRENAAPGQGVAPEQKTGYRTYQVKESWGDELSREPSRYGELRAGWRRGARFKQLGMDGLYLSGYVGQTSPDAAAQAEGMSDAELIATHNRLSSQINKNYVGGISGFAKTPEGQQIGSQLEAIEKELHARDLGFAHASEMSGKRGEVDYRSWTSDPEVATEVNRLSQLGNRDAEIADLYLQGMTSGDMSAAKRAMLASAAMYAKENNVDMDTAYAKVEGDAFNAVMRDRMASEMDAIYNKEKASQEARQVEATKGIDPGASPGSAVNFELQSRRAGNERETLNAMTRRAINESPASKMYYNMQMRSYMRTGMDPVHAKAAAMNDLRNLFRDREVERMSPSGDWGYVGGSAFYNNMPAELFRGLTNLATGDYESDQILDEAYARYGKEKASTMAKVGASVAPFVVDMALGSFKVPGLVAKIGQQTISKGLLYGARWSLGVADDVILRRMGGNILYRTLMGGLGGGLNFMTYNAMSAAVRGFKDNNFGWNTVVEEGKRGFADGIVFGGVNGLAGKLTDVAKGAWVIPAELGVLAVEGGTFTALDYMRTKELTPESVGTSFGMAIAGRMTHFGQWASDVAARVNGTKWKNTVTGPVRLSKETCDELQDRYLEICRLMSDGELAKAMVKGARGKVTSQEALDTGVAIDKEWEAMQNDSSVPFEVRRMVNYALNGQVTPKPVTCNYRISSVGDATYGETLDINGNVIDRYKLESEKDRVNFEQGVALEAERNRIGLEQNAYVAQEYYPHLADAVEAVAAEYGMDPNELLDNYYKKDIKGKAMRKAVDKVEQLYLAEIEGKTDIVSAVNDKYGVDIEEALKVPIHERIEAEHNAIAEYEQRLTGRYDEAQDKSTAELVAEDMEQSRNDGFEAQGDERADIKERLEDAANALTEMRIDPRQFDSMDENAISDWLESRGNNADEVDAVMEYLDARSAFEGICDRVQDEAGKRIEEAAKETDDRTNNDTGMIHPVVMGDDREAFVVSGRVVVNADGTIDLEKSDRDIVVRYPDEEQPVMTTADKIKSGEPTIDPEAAKQETADGIMQEVAGEAVSQMNRDLAFNEGDTFTVLVDGKPVELTVVGTDPNTGNPILQDSTGRRAPGYPDIVQQMHDEWREWVKNGGQAAVDNGERRMDNEGAPTPEAPSGNAAPVKERPAEEQAAGPAIMPTPGQGDPQEMLNYFRASGMSDRVADRTITNNIVAANERLEKAERELNESKETDPQKLAELDRAAEEAQRDLDYWNAVGRRKWGNAPEGTAAQQQPTEQAGAPTAENEMQPVEEPAREEYQGDGMSDEMRERMDDGTGIVGIVDNIARQLGLKVRDWDGPEGIPGYIDPDNGVIYINRNRVEGTRDTYRFTLGHELTHGLKRLAEDMGRPELYEALRGAALSTVRVREGSGYDKFVSDLMNRYRSAHYMDAYGEAIAAGRSKAEAIEAGRAEADRVTQDFIEEEIVCDTVGELLSGDESRARELLKQVEDKSVMQRIKNYFTELLTKVRDAFGKGSKEYDYIDGVINRFNEMYNEVLKQREEMEMNERESGEDHVKFSLVEDQNEVKRLEEEPKMEGYRNVSLQGDGSLRSPMANRLGKKGEKSRPTQGFFLGQWEKADENPDLATDDGKINLKKPGGLGSVDNVDYNPYIHIRPTLVNKQFKNAWERDDLVYVKTQYPASEEAQGYHAEKAALPVGRHPWNGGELILSRWDKPVEIVPWERVADDWEAEFKDRGVEFDIVPPKLLPILAERGVEILPPHAGMGKRCNDAYEVWKSEHSDGHGGGKSVDSAVAEAEQVTETNPTDGQKESGNYRKGHVKVDGFDISIEQPKGSVRSGVDADGKEWSQEMHNTYGYIRGTEGVDGDHIDVFLSDHLDSWNGMVYVVDQVNKDGSFDEHKVMYGFDSEQEARDAYLSNYEEGWTGLGNITGVTRDEFKKWVDSSHRKTKPFAEYKSVKVSRPIQGLEGYTEYEILADVRAFIEQQLEDAGIEGVTIKGMALHGSRMRGDARPDSDLDVVVEYEGDISEDSFFNLVNYDLNFRGPNGVIIDINPITRGKSGTLEQYMERSRRYDEEKIRVNNAQYNDNADARFSLSPEQQEAQTHSENFKRWFGDWENDPENASKVVDEEGKPLVVYHQTNAKRWINRETGEDWEKLDWRKKMEWESRPQEEWEDAWEEQDFYTFDDRYARQSIEMPAIFFSPNNDPYHEYGQRTIAAYLDIKNPAINPDIPNRGVTDTAGRDAMEALKAQGYDGFIRTDEDGNILEYGVFDSSQVKSATENNGEFSRENPDIRYSLADPFYSNAAKAVEGVKQEKAKAEQWKAMLTKAGGIKAGEDKWMGLSQWLDEHKGETLTKEQVRQFVAENGVQMEEVGYSEAPDTFESLKREYDQWLHDEGFDYAQEQLRERFGDDADIAFDDLGGELVVANEEAAAAVLGSENIINSTRLEYTTEGLENKREIAFVVPDVEPYQENDEIHFGPENQGRAVMWVRFGEARDADGNRVLVIDEIQSNRHQDAREGGYRPREVYELRRKRDELKPRLKELSSRLQGEGITEEEIAEYRRLGDEDYRLKNQIIELITSSNGSIPAAPFEKNWHEVAMKRMLRLAAEEGFDKVAWTTGMQQAERYDIGKRVDKIEVHDLYDGLHEVQGFKDGKAVFSQETENGEQGLAEMLGKEMARKAYSNLHEGETDYTDENGRVGFSGEDLQIGGEGMKGFYDQILPRFMDKYGKRWGVKTGEVTLDTPGKEVMHSVDVNEDMKRSVMQGQPLFSVAEEDQKLFDGAKRKFGVTRDIREAGYVLPDGTMLDFSGRHELNPGTDSSFLKGRRTTDHRAISQISFVYDENGDEVDTGLKTDMPDFIKRGAIRIDDNAGSVNLYTPPTAAQRKVLRELISRNGGDVQVDFGDGWDSDHYVEYEGTNARRVLADIDRYFDEGIKPEGNARFSLSEEIENYRPEQVSWERGMLDRLLQNAAKNAERKDMRKQATREVNRTLRGLFDRLSAPGADAGNLGFDISRATQAAARAQRGYDRWTVDELVSMAKSMLKSGMYKELQPYEVQRLVNMINQGVGRREIQDQMNTVFDVLMKANLRGWSAQLKKLMSTKPYSINSQTGVRTIGQVDGLGGQILTAMRRGLEMTGDELTQRIAEVSDRIDSDDTASHELEGLMLTQQYNDLVGKYDADNKNIKDLIREQQEKVYDFYQVPVLDEDGNPKYHQRTGEQLFETRKRLKPEFGGLDAEGNRQPVSDENKALRQRVEATVAGLENSMRENWVRMSEGYDRITDDLGGNVAAAVTRAKEFRENEKLRKQQIYHAANSDLLGVEDNTETVDPSQQVSPANWSFVRGLLGPLATFEKMMRFFGRRSAGGEGRLFNMFVRRQIDCGDREWRDKKAGMDEMDNKAKELFGKKWMTMGNEMRDGKKFPFITLSYFDKTGKPRTIDLRQDEAVYLYCVNKMRDGQMKLNAMGIDGDMVEQIVQRLDPRLVELADWYQGEFLPKHRNRYNETYERMFGTPMAHIDNYIHLNINKNETASNQEIGQTIGDQRGPTYVTGSLKERKTNVTPIELRTSIFDLAWSEHDKMEHWNAWGEFSRDLKDLINYRNFKAKVRNMKSVEFGNGKELLDNFSRCAAIVTGDYDNPGRHAKIDRAATNLAKGVTSAKIGFRAFTALKQTLSFPAFFSDARPDDLLFAIGNAEGTIKWAMENLPGFSKRWQSRQAGDTRLMETDSDWKVWKNSAVKKIGTASMLPNASVDCLTVAIGARGVYRTAKRRYLDYGFSEAQAEKRALQDAAISYNASQQSSEGAFTSAQQVDRTLAGVATTVFRNASMGYERRFTQGLRNLKNMAKRGYREEVIENTKKQMMEEGLTEEQAERAAERVYNRMKWHSMVDVVNFGFMLPFFWNLGPAMVYILGGEDDEQKKELVRDSALHALYGPVEGLSMGGTISELANIITGSMLMDEKSFKETMQGLRHRNFNPLPIISDMQSVFNSFATDTWSGVNDVFNIVVQMGVGVNPETVTNMTWGIIDACQGDMDLARKTAFAFLRFINAPASQVDKLYMDELGITKDEASRMSWDELAKKYARYHAVKDATVIAPFLSDEAEAAREERYVDRFYDRAMEQLEKADDEDLQRVYGQGDEAKKMVAKAKAKQEGLDEERFSKKPNYKAKESTKKGYDTYSRKRSYSDMAEDILLQKAEEEAKANGDDERAGNINKVLDAIASKCRGDSKKGVKGMGVDKETDDKILEKIRETRSKALKELKITR